MALPRIPWHPARFALHPSRYGGAIKPHVLVRFGHVTKQSEVVGLFRKLCSEVSCARRSQYSAGVYLRVGFPVVVSHMVQRDCGDHRKPKIGQVSSPSAKRRSYVHVIVVVRRRSHIFRGAARSIPFLKLWRVAIGQRVDRFF